MNHNRNYLRKELNRIKLVGNIFFTLCIFSNHSLYSQKEYDAELVYQEVFASVNNKKLTTKYSYEIRINNRKGEKYTRVYIPYYGSDGISKLTALIKDKNGKTVRKLKKDEITDKSAISYYSFYEDSFVKEFTLKHNEYPYNIFYSYEIKESEFMHIDYWQPVLSSDIPTLKAVLILETPENYKIKYKSNLQSKPTIENIDFKNRYKWETKYIDLFEKEVLSPPLSEYLPFVFIVPENFDYALEGSFSTWKSFGNWQFELITNLSELPQKEKIKINSVINGIDNEREQIKALYHYLQDETRYINVSIDIGGLKPYPASYVADNKYGDCKALSNYFKSVLEYVGIKSYYTKVYADDVIKVIDESFPSQQFNHIILCVPTIHDTIWLDCTSDGPFNYLGTFSQGRKAFVISNNKSTFVNTPKLTKEDVHNIRKIKVEPTNQSLQTVTFNTIYRGESFELLHYITTNLSNSQADKEITKTFIDKGFDMVDLNVQNEGRDSTRISLNHTATSNHLYKYYGNDLIVNPIKFELPPFEIPKKRKLPIQINYPIYKTDTIEYLFPKGYSTNDIPIKRKIVASFGEYYIETFPYNNRVIIVKSVLINAGNYDDYQAFYNFLGKISKIENSSKISLTKNQ